MQRRSQRKRHFWRLDSKSITLFQHDSSPNFYKEILISEILAINIPATFENYGFELLTKSISYFCGEFNNSDTKEWENAIRKVYMPSLNEKELNKLPSITDKNELPTIKTEFDRIKQSNQLMQDLQQSQKQANKQDRTGELNKIITMTNASSKENENSNQQSDFDISLQYQIFPDESAFTFLRIYLSLS